MSQIFRVLIVDDDKVTRKLYRGILKEFPEFRVREAQNGKEALDLIGKSTPDIVISDLMMPEMDGLELCRHIKGDVSASLSSIYLIMVSAKETKEDKMACMREGADDYLFKPVDKEELLARIKVGQRIAARIRKTEMETRRMFEEIDVLLVQDGGMRPRIQSCHSVYNVPFRGDRQGNLCHGRRIEVSGFRKTR